MTNKRRNQPPVVSTEMIFAWVEDPPRGLPFEDAQLLYDRDVEGSPN